MNDGKIVQKTLNSECLVGNPLKDKVDREVWIYLPPGYDENKGSGYPTLMMLAGYTGSGPSLFRLDPLTEDLKAKCDRLIKEKKTPPFIMVAPDCCTRLAGNQYINSEGTGNWEG